MKAALFLSVGIMAVLALAIAVSGVLSRRICGLVALIAVSATVFLAVLSTVFTVFRHLILVLIF